MTFNLRRSKLETLSMSPDEEEAIAEDEAAKLQQAIRPDLGLLKVRKRTRLNQIQMADKVGVSRKTYQLYESGKLPIPSDKLARVIAYFNVDIRELFWGQAFPTDRSLKMDCAEMGMTVYGLLVDEYKHRDGLRIEKSDAKRIALAYVRQHELGEELDQQDLWRCIQLVTGSKYLPDLNGQDYFTNPEGFGPGSVT